VFGCHVIGLNRTIKNRKYYDEIKPLSELGIELAKAYIVVVLITLMNDTVYLLSKQNLSPMKER